MNTENVKEDEVVEKNTISEENGNDKKPFKKEKNRFDFALFVNDSLICKRNFPINGYIEKSMQTVEFKNEVDKIVELIKADLQSKSRVYTWYHTPEFQFVDGTLSVPEWEPEIMTDPLIDEGTSIFKFVIYDNGNEVISRSWDGRYYPMYVRKNVDLTNRQVKITKNEHTNIYDKETFFADHEQISGELYVLKHMIMDKDDLIPIIHKCIYEVCSSYDGYYEKISDYHAIDTYCNDNVKCDANGNPIYKQKTVLNANGEDVPVFDAFGNPWMVPVLDKSKSKSKGKKYYLNIDAYNKKIESNWGSSVAEKTRKYMSELYITPRDKHSKKKNED